MYRQGLGDCFLIALPRAGAGPFHVLIDCGVLLGTKDAAETMTRVAEDIAATTARRLDVVVATHEHWDHLSGFIQAQSVFDKMQIGEVWLAWTEDPTDDLAAHLRREREQALRGLRTAVARLAGLDAAAAQRLSGPLAFFGAASGPGTREALNYLVHHPSGPKVRYHRPGGDPLPLADVAGAKVYVLGPPRDEKLIRRSNPTKSGHEVYELGPGLAAFDPARAAPDNDDELVRGSDAFEERYRIPQDSAVGMSFFQKHYFALPDEWRRIDAAWLGGAEQLALALDNHTNNTSLALAVELEPQGRVLLFPGDAQVGNWLSWNNCPWNTATPPISAADLLHRTVLYKTGHHGSHNATLREQGLERMVSPELVALVPVDRGMAERKRWNMPFPALYTRLLERTRGRVLRADQPPPDRPETTSQHDWDSFLARVTPGADDLFYDYLL
jgi:beta-lactamase superfamily II metal-dependent hydrolase